MENFLAALGLLLVVGVIVMALLRIAPKHDKEMNNAFEEYAMKHGLRYQAGDDGRASEFAATFNGVREPDPASPGGSTPRHVVSGLVDGQRIVVFQCGAADTEDGRGERVVAGVEVKKKIAGRCSVQFRDREADNGSADLADPIVKEADIGAFRLVVRAGDAAAAGPLLGDPALERLAAVAAKLACRPELQVRDRRIIVYPAERDTKIDHASGIDDLMRLAKTTARIAG